MSHLFNQKIDRRQTDSVKWDHCKEFFHSDDVLPMWIADMDFRNPQPVLDHLSKVVEHGVLGYTCPCDSLYNAIIDWQKNRHQLFLKKEEILFSPGVVPSMGLLIQALTEEKDAVLIHDPVYPPFSHIVENNNRTLIRSSLTIEEGKYRMNIEEMEQLIQKHKIKMFLLCHPHNPGGRVWSKEELQAVADLCARYNVLVVSDEIHGDLMYPGVDFVSPVTMKEHYKDFIITLTSVTKTFNLAGIKNSMMFILNEQIREQVQMESEKLELCAINTFGLVGTEAALRKGDEWLEELMIYLDENRRIACAYFDEHLPDSFYMNPQATYLLWFNVSSLNVPDEDLKDHFAHVGKIGLNDGISYGPLGSQFMRLNFAVPQSVLLDGLERIKLTFESSKKIDK